MILDGDSIRKRIEEAELFTRRFGSFNKTDYEVLMFTIYLDSLPVDKQIFDYIISKDLGITETKVRSLRIKSQLLYPKELDWKGILSKAIKNGRYSEVDNMITISIEDPSCLNRVRFEVEAAYGTVDLTNNKKQLKLPIESVISLALEIDSESEKDILTRLNEEWKKQNKQHKQISRESLGKRVLKSCGSVGSFLISTQSVWDASKSIISSMIDLINGIK